MDEGETPITGYLVEYKHPVISGILTNKITTFNTEHVMCKLQVSGHPRELKVDVRGINKVGRGFRSNTVKVSFYSEFALAVILKRVVGFTMWGIDPSSF